ncbi:hypothetical protein AGMMS50229_17360 [Campylobacterota bacterium]|nr:hypothetical protein AGMMS50229_17360 [Campylobacterota bacterium]
MATKIYIIHHQAEKYPVFANNVVTPILAGQVGERGVRVPLKDTEGRDCIRDEARQDLYSEFTALWWVWKNAEHKPDDIVGFMHYRSFLDLNNGQRPRNAFAFENRYGYTEEKIRKFMDGTDRVDHLGRKSGGNGVDILTSEPLLLPPNLFAQFDSCCPIVPLLFDKTKLYLSRDARFSGLAGYFDQHFYRNSIGFYKCLFIWKYSVFSQFCEFLFYILDSLFADTDVQTALSTLENIKGPDRAETQKRTKFRLFAFLGERLSSLFIAYSCLSGKVGLAPRVHYEKLSDLIKQVYPCVRDRHGREFKPLFRMFSHKHDTHIAVSDYNELDSLLAEGKEFHFEGLLGYCIGDKSKYGPETFIPEGLPERLPERFKRSYPTTKPLYRLKRDGSKTKYYYDTIVQPGQWSIKIGDIEYNYNNCKPDGVLGYVGASGYKRFESDNMYGMCMVYHGYFGYLCATEAEAKAIVKAMGGGEIAGLGSLYNIFFDQDMELM